MPFGTPQNRSRLRAVRLKLSQQVGFADKRQREYIQAMIINDWGLDIRVNLSLHINRSHSVRKYASLKASSCPLRVSRRLFIDSSVFVSGRMESWGCEMLITRQG